MAKKRTINEIRQVKDSVYKHPWEEKQKLKVELVNEVIFLNDRMEELWRYHPENPNKVDVVWEYNNMKNELDLIEDRIQQLGG